MRISTISLLGCLLLHSILVPSLARAHGYSFKNSPQEMRDDIHIRIAPSGLVIQYTSVYQGQLAPHTRLMIDTNQDGSLSDGEAEQFRKVFLQRLNEELRHRPWRFEGKPFRLRADSLQFPTLFSDSLLAPLRVKLILSSQPLPLTQGRQVMEFDPRIFFLCGNLFVQMAKEQVEYSEEQDKATSRFIQLQVKGPPEMQFLSTFPGRLKNKGKSIFIFGVFYDQTLLQLKRGEYPPFRFEFFYPGTL